MRDCRECLSVSFDYAMIMCMRENALLIDVRTAEEYEKAHIKGSISIPLTTLTANAYKYLPDTSRKIVVCCATGARSQVACQLLHEMGYRYVYTIYEGIEKVLNGQH